MKASPELGVSDLKSQCHRALHIAGHAINVHHMNRDVEENVIQLVIDVTVRCKDKGVNTRLCDSANEIEKYLLC